MTLSAKDRELLELYDRLGDPEDDFERHEFETDMMALGYNKYTALDEA